MGFLDFLTKPRISATPRDPMTVTPYEQPQAEPVGGLLSDMPQTVDMGAPQPLRMGAPQQMQQMPQIEEGPSLLGDLASKFFGTTAQGDSFTDRLYAFGETLNGGDGMGYLNARRGDVRAQNERAEAEAKKKRDEAEAKADLARRNAAFRGAYKDGRFDPQAYMAALGDQGDATEAFSLARALAPKAGVDGGTAYTQDPLTGETRWGEQRAESPAERLRREQMEELEAYRDEQIRLREEALGLSRQREGRIAAGRPSGGAAGGPPPPGPGWSVQAVGP